MWLQKCLRVSIQEIKILRHTDSLFKLSHDNVCCLIGFSTRPAILFFEYCGVIVNGEEVDSLRTLLDVFNENKYFNLIERLNYCIQASLGLQYLHKSDIHQDFKPTNLLVTGTLDDTILKCSDFGDLAHAKSTMKSISTHNNIKGMTSGFIAPEILTCSVKPNINTGVYALGFSIFEIVSDMANPKEKTFPIFSDVLLFEKVKGNERPDATEVCNIYKDQAHEIQGIMEMAENCWQTSPVHRPKLQEV